ncbi:MAG: hypothetical protein KKD39_01165 [Candidatus Altiarchaeota archaeon]|nr:hypothetical protein [Candidatus Altiarchaeota archaeon]
MKPSGQMFSGDFLLGFVIFFAALTLILSVWSTTTREILSGENHLAMEERGSDAVEKLLRTEGIPRNWSETNVLSVGLANSSRILQETKVSSFITMMRDNVSGDCGGTYTKYECKRYLLGMGEYNFLINISNLSGSTVYVNGMPAVSGRFPVNQSLSLKIERTAVYMGEIVRIDLTAWK